MNIEHHRNPDGTYNGVGVMADLTGLSRQSAAEIAEQVRANHDALESCDYHEFSAILPRQERLSRQRYRCAHCGGEVNHSAWFWHEKGRRPEHP